MDPFGPKHMQIRIPNTGNVFSLGSQTTQTLTSIFTGSLLRTKETSPDTEAAEATGTFEMIRQLARLRSLSPPPQP